MAWKKHTVGSAVPIALAAAWNVAKVLFPVVGALIDLYSVIVRDRSKKPVDDLPHHSHPAVRDLFTMEPDG